MVSPQRITALLDEWSHGDRAALDALVPIAEAELHRRARRYMCRERPGHTLQTAAVVNEAYIRLADCEGVRWQNRAHFFGITFGGLSVEETAEVLKVAERTVNATGRLRAPGCTTI